MSTFFYIPGLLHFLENADSNKIHAPLIKYSEHYHVNFPVGFCIIMSKIIVNKLMTNLTAIKIKYTRENIFKKFPDDILFGIIFQDLNIHYSNIRHQLINCEEIYHIIPANVNILNEKFIFRNREFHFYIDREGRQQADITKRLHDEIPRWELIVKHCI